MKDDPSVLVVDDNLGNLLAMEATLSSLPCRVIKASSGAEALREVLRTDLAVVLLDVQMPRLGGFETAKLMRQCRGERHVPVIFLTSNPTDRGFLYKGYSLGAIDYLFKPFDPDVVRAKVGALVDLFRRSEEVRRREEALRHAAVRRAEEALRENEVEYVATFEEAPVGIAHLGLDERWRRVNARLCSLLGYSKNELHEMKLTHVVHPIDAPELLEVFHRVATLEHSHRTERRLVGKGGAVVWADITMSALRDGWGRARKVIVVVEDVGDQKLLAQASEILLSSLDRRSSVERVVELAVPSIADACVVELEGGPAMSACVNADVAMHAASAARGVDQALTKTAGDRTFHVVPLRVHGRRLGTMIFAWQGAARSPEAASDLAHLVSFALENARLYAGAQQAISARDEFLSIASHELRTPLTALQLQLQRIVSKKGALSISEDRLRQMLERSERQVQRLAQLVDNLLDVSSIRSGNLKLAPELFDLGDVVREVCGRFSEQVARARCSLDLTEERRAIGRWDRLRVEQVVTNLLANAIKYSAGKPIAITVTADATSARLTIVDQGIGIPEERLPYIFGRFERAVSPRAYGGLGLGLYITQQIVDAHGGHVHVTSQEGVGSKFVVELPLARAESGSAVTEQLQGAPAGGPS